MLGIGCWVTKLRQNVSGTAVFDAKKSENEPFRLWFTGVDIASSMFSQLTSKYANHSCKGRTVLRNFLWIDVFKRLK